MFEPCLDDFFGLDRSIPFRRIGAEPERKQLRPVPGRVLAVLAVGSVEILWVELKGKRVSGAVPGLQTLVRWAVARESRGGYTSDSGESLLEPFAQRAVLSDVTPAREEAARSDCTGGFLIFLFVPMHDFAASARADEQPADAAASSTDADPDASRLQDTRLPAAGAEAAEDPALTRDSEVSSARSHSPRGQSSPTSRRQGKRPDATGLSASQEEASASADEQPADASASSTDADPDASRSAQKKESDSFKAANALKARVDGSPAELQEGATGRSRPGKKATSPSSRSPAAGAEAAEDPALTRDSEVSRAIRPEGSPLRRHAGKGRGGKKPDAIGVSTSREASARADARPADASASSADVDAGASRSARRKREPDPVNAANTLEDRRPAAGAEAAEDSEELPRDSGRTARSHSPRGRSSPTPRRQGKRQADTGIVASQEAASGRADSQPADAAANSSDTDADASRPDVPGVSLDTWPTRDSSTAANFEDHSDVQRTEPDKMSGLQRAKPTSRAQSGPKENLGGRDEGTRDKSATGSLKKGGEASKTGPKEPSRSTSPTTEKQQRGEAPSVKAPAASVSEGKLVVAEHFALPVAGGEASKTASKEPSRSTSPTTEKQQRGEAPSAKAPAASVSEGTAKSPKWDFKKGDDPSKKTSQQDPARSTTAKPDRQQAAEGSGSSSTAKPRADEASTPPQSPRPLNGPPDLWLSLWRGSVRLVCVRGQSATWSFKKGGEASKTASKEPSRQGHVRKKSEKTKHGQCTSCVRDPAAGQEHFARDGEAAAWRSSQRESAGSLRERRAKSPKWDFKKGDDPSKKTSQQDPARSTTAKPDRQQAAEGSGSSSTAKPRADEASTGQSATWSFKKGGEASKTASKEPSRSTSPTTEKQQRGEAPSAKAPAASVSEGKLVVAEHFALPVAGGEASKTASKEPSRSTSPTTEKQQRGEAPSAKAPAASVSEGWVEFSERQPAWRAQSPKWDFKKGDDPSKKTSQQDPARSTTAKPDRQQAAEGSGSSSTAKPRADEASTGQSATWSFKKGGEASKTASKEPSRSTSPTTEKQQRGEAPSAKAPAASVNEGKLVVAEHFALPVAGGEASKTASKEPSRSTSPTTEKQQRGEAPSAKAPAASVNEGKLVVAEHFALPVAGGEASKTASKEPSRSTSPTTEKQQRGEAPSVKAPAASVSKGPIGADSADASLHVGSIVLVLLNLPLDSSHQGGVPLRVAGKGTWRSSAAGKWSKYVALQRSRSASNEDSAREPASRDKKWNFAERVLRSRSPSAGAEERSHRRSTLLDACIGEAGDSLAPKLGTDAPLNADSLAQYFQAKRDAERTGQAPAAHSTQEELERVPRFGSEASSEEGPPTSLPLQLLQAELKTMKVSDLRDRAATYGCAEETVRAALDSPTPKSALTELILDVARDASDALMEMSWTELKQHAEEMGITEAFVSFSVLRYTKCISVLLDMSVCLYATPAAQLAGAQEGKNPKVALIMAIFGSGSDQGSRSRPGPHQLGSRLKGLSFFAKALVPSAWSGGRDLNSCQWESALDFFSTLEERPEDVMQPGSGRGSQKGGGDEGCSTCDSGTSTWKEPATLRRRR
ncbi:unnamed protein product [Symbiodinium natans]|uniref:Uncharacterized protein n=1 Tax=Symbiodinium natans TaxID=878477 RepID=A0A812I4G2_9DINO|nr:unnamed protein product [Symbiodinium natans]